MFHKLGREMRERLGQAGQFMIPGIGLISQRLIWKKNSWHTNDTPSRLVLLVSIIGLLDVTDSVKLFICFNQT